MGHGDEIALVDANFPASSLRVPVIRLDGASVIRALDAVLSVLILDDFVPETTWRMQVVDQADQEIPIFARESIARRAGPHVRLASLERFALYERTRGAFRVVATGEALRQYTTQERCRSSRRRCRFTRWRRWFGLIDASSPIAGTRYASADFGATDAPHSSLPA
jgi:L-fucose mutarotase